MAALSLPEGRSGRLLAVLVTLLALALVWRAVLAPLTDWYDARQRTVRVHEAAAWRALGLARRLPMLGRQAQALQASGQESVGALTEGGSDAVASAAIQEKVAAMAASLGLSLASTETLAASREGAYRRVGVRISLDASFPVVVRLLHDIESARPSLLVDDLQVHGTRLLNQPEDAPLNVALSVLGFRAPDPRGAGSGAPDPSGPDTAPAPP